MNNRDYKQFSSGEFYHVFNRGNNKNNIFFDDEDYLFFLNRLEQNLFPEKNRGRIQPLPDRSFSLICYCLMPNHFHFLLRQNSEIPVSKLIAKVSTSYSKYFNQRRGSVGHVFQDQFKQVNVAKDIYLQWLSAYIHQNPVVAGLATSPEQYRWSSYPDYVGQRNDRLCEKDIILSQHVDVDHYRRFVLDSYALIKGRKEAID